ncbi:hypothetical protein TRFO_37517 [Tritrichomonas foetus]|uniref:Uncharacterized protein n=1 Tax=Tritrichomonas foetus TaxID=1144522 RepID=A0A1J4JDE4_9EUKA|nr:hypothetical protein TRFO_37517 [Tritrichomonas foetus]|eukprot:OHS96303.1 hypothetical protein TRFO_37517 [Tritrichomonas foetus]
MFEQNPPINYYITQQQQQQYRGPPQQPYPQGFIPYQYQIYPKAPMSMYSPEVPGMMIQPDQMYQQQQIRPQQAELQQAAAAAASANQFIVRSPKQPPNVQPTDPKKKAKIEPPQQQQQMQQQQSNMMQQQQIQHTDAILTTKDSFQPNMNQPPGFFNIVPRGNIPAINFICDYSSCYGFE